MTDPQLDRTLRGFKAEVRQELQGWEFGPDLQARVKERIAAGEPARLHRSAPARVWKPLFGAVAAAAAVAGILFMNRGIFPLGGAGLNAAVGSHPAEMAAQVPPRNTMAARQESATTMASAPPGAGESTAGPAEAAVRIEAAGGPESLAPARNQASAKAAARAAPEPLAEVPTEAVALAQPEAAPEATASMAATATAQAEATAVAQDGPEAVALKAPAAPAPEAPEARTLAKTTPDQALVAAAAAPALPLNLNISPPPEAVAAGRPITVKVELSALATVTEPIRITAAVAGDGLGVANLAPQILQTGLPSGQTWLALFVWDQKWPDGSLAPAGIYSFRIEVAAGEHRLMAENRFRLTR